MIIQAVNYITDNHAYTLSFITKRLRLPKYFENRNLFTFKSAIYFYSVTLPLTTVYVPVESVYVPV